MSELIAGQQVRLRYDPGRIGVLTDKLRKRGELSYRYVRFSEIGEWIAEDELEAVGEVPEDPIEILRSGPLGKAGTLRRLLTHIRLSGRLANVVYSMETTNTDFYAYQFKPVLKFLNSPANGILIADEVGLGKTIEAGLIWTELRSRYDADRLLVLCPAMLRGKWINELRDRFGVDADESDAEMTLDILRRSLGEGKPGGFALIGSFSGLRPPRGWQSKEDDRHPSARQLLARFLQEHAEDQPLLDLLVIDEAHYLRNPESMTADLGRLLKGVAQHVVLLSATPIHLRSEDLHYLLALLDEDTFNNPGVFNSILQANEPLVRARDLVLSGRANAQTLRELLESAASNSLLSGNRQLRNLLESLPDDAGLADRRQRSDLAYRLETVNLLGHTVTRTRKREVNEWRVQREAVAEAVPMTDAERRFYMGVTQIVRDYSGRHGGMEGFLLATPQRQLSSSMPAALRHWREIEVDLEQELYEDLGIEDEDQAPAGPLVREIASRVAQLAVAEELELHDSKFLRFGSLVAEFVKDHPEEKIVVFSYFRATLSYLAERLEKLGIRCTRLVGDQGLDKNAVLADFKDPNGPTVLLSSEVGSEGIDLQLCRVMVNYDLPWNPMRVEQRIGRLDRIGQRAQKITIWNLFYAGTIDDRIYERLYKRLGIFERALGGLEAILGEKIQQLSSELLAGNLTPEQEGARIEQTAQAIEIIQRDEEHLESEASNLVAYGDYILNQVRAAKELRRVITGEDLEPYVLDFFHDRYPGSVLRLLDPASRLYEIELSEKARFDLSNFVEDSRLQRFTALHRASSGSIRCRFENKMASTNAKGIELINQVHPIVRFASREIRRLNRGVAGFFPAVAVRLRARDLPKAITSGVYAFVAHRWAVEGLQSREHLFITSARLDKSSEPLPDEVAEQLIVRASTEGLDWLEAENVLARDRAAAVAMELALGAERRYADFVRRMKDENNDRADFQLTTLQRHLRGQTEKLEMVRARHVEAGRPNLAKATTAHIERLRRSVEMKRLRIEERRKLESRHDEICVGVVEVSE